MGGEFGVEREWGDIMYKKMGGVSLKFIKRWKKCSFKNGFKFKKDVV